MKITIDETSAKQYSLGFPRGGEINEITLHGTGGIGLLRLMRERKMGRDSEYVRGISLFHYLVQRDGSIVRILDEDRYVYHSSSSAHDQVTLGLEVENAKIDGDFLPAQYQALSELIVDIISRHPIEIISSHSYNFKKFSPVFWEKWAKDNGRYYSCPGKNFAWMILAQELEGRGIKVEENDGWLKVV